MDVATLVKESTYMNIEEYMKKKKQKNKKRKRNNKEISDKTIEGTIEGQIQKNIERDITESINETIETDIDETVEETSEETENISYPTCAICLESITDLARQMSCQHMYHVQCIDKWLSNHTNCPQCRQSYVPSDDEEETIIPITIDDLLNSQFDHNYNVITTRRPTNVFDMDPMENLDTNLLESDLDTHDNTSNIFFNIINQNMERIMNQSNTSNNTNIINTNIIEYPRYLFNYETPIERDNEDEYNREYNHISNDINQTMEDLINVIN